jgi:hypothetical protein
MTVTDNVTPGSPSGVERDPILRTLVDIVEGGYDEKELRVTLTVGDFLIFGTIVPEWQWLEQVGLDVFPEKKEQYERRKDLRSRAASDLTEEEQKDVRFSPRFIHLDPATVLADGKPIANPDPPFRWRGNLQHVSGWCKGAMTVARPAA